jgi:hypothetical protein
MEKFPIHFCLVYNIQITIILNGPLEKYKLQSCMEDSFKIPA